MIKTLKIAVGILIGLMIVIQFIRPERISTDRKMDSDIRNHMTIPSHVEEVLVRSCYDCHSMNTVWPWYSNLTPMSWLIAVDVNKGRKQLNFSFWEDYSSMIQTAKLSLICNTIQTGKMPLKQYTMIHKDAKLTHENVDEICKWAEEHMKRLRDQ
ncbi:heme-binding domain-containing protein [Candidatus Latescibacterota bacterium]